jgi:protein-disulfide reductase (glutathione)
MNGARVIVLLGSAWLACSKAPAQTPPPAALPPSGPAPTANAEGWNAGAVAWVPFDDALPKAAAEHKPICLIFFTSWCPHCKHYSHVFDDPRVVQKAQSFVMVRADQDKNGPLAARFAPDGQYIPRTYFLSADGQLDPSLNTGNDRYKYFYRESDPDDLLGAMDRALAKLK